MDRLKKEKDKLIYIFIGIFFIYIFKRIPLIQDAWVGGDFYSGQVNIFTAILATIKLYFTLNGRLIAGIVVAFFERNETVLDITNTVILMSIVFYITRIIWGRKNKNIGILVSFVMLLLVANTIRTEVYFYATMIYIVPVLALLVFLDELYNLEIVTAKKRVLLISLAIINTGWIEHTGFGFLVALVFLVIIAYYRKNSNSRVLVESCIAGICTFLIMIKSPGLSANRQFKTQGELVQMVISNIVYTIDTMITQQILMILLIVITSALIFFKKRDFWGLVFNTIIAIILIINNVSFYLGVELPNFLILKNIGDNRNIFIGWGIIIFFIICIDVLKNNTNKVRFSFMAGIASLIPIIITPNFGYRICFFAAICLGFIIVENLKILLIEYDKIDKYIYIIILCLLIIRVDEYSLAVEKIHKIQKEREIILNEVYVEQKLGKWDYNETVIIPIFPPGLLYADASPQKYIDPIHYACFLNFYGLSEKTLVLFSNNQDVLNVRVSENKVYMCASLDNEQNSSIEYCVENNGEIIDAVSGNYNEEVCIDIPDTLSGITRFYCKYNVDSGNEIILYAVKYIEN